MLGGFYHSHRKYCSLDTVTMKNTSVGNPINRHSNNKLILSIELERRALPAQKQTLNPHALEPKPPNAEELKPKPQALHPSLKKASQTSVAQLAVNSTSKSTIEHDLPFRI